MSKAIKFHTKIIPGGKTAAGIKIPPEIISTLGTSRKPPVKITINGYSYRSTVAVMGGDFMVSFSSEKREAAGVERDSEVDVLIELDTEPRTVEIPEDLMKALKKKNGAFDAFEKSAPSKKKEFVRQVNDAKTQETRDRRITKIVDELK